MPAVCAGLLLAVWIIYSPTLRFAFVNYDDPTYVYANPHVSQGLRLENIAWAFTHGYGSNWHPLTWISHMLDCQWYRLWPGGHHLTNVLLHAATAIGLFLVACRMTGRLWTSAFAAALFAVHPLRVESVAWVAERKDVLSGLFFVLTLAAYAEYVRHPFSWARYAAVVVLYALGLMAKPMLVTLPLILLLLDYWPLGRLLPSQHPGDPPQAGGGLLQVLWLRVREKIPLFVLAAASCWVTIIVQHGAIQPMDRIPLLARIGNALAAYVVYVFQFAWPSGLVVFYPHEMSSLPLWKAVGAALLLVGVSTAAWLGRRACPALWVGWMWYLITLLPVIGLLQVGLQARADRYTYLPQIGLAIAVAWGVEQFTRSWPYRRATCALAAAAVLAVLAVAASQQTAFWSDSETLWTRAVQCTGGNPIAYSNLCEVLNGQGRYADAATAARRALDLAPEDADAWHNLGMAAQGQGKIEAAIAMYGKALEFRPRSALTHYNLGLALAQQNKPERAIFHYERCLAISSDNAQAHNNLAIVLEGCGRMGEAIGHYRKALELDHENLAAHFNLATCLRRRGQLDEAASVARRALTLAEAQGEENTASRLRNLLGSLPYGGEKGLLPTSEP